MTSKWNIPKLAIDIKHAGEAAPRYRWSVVLIMPDADGTRPLGYRRSGYLSDDLVSLTYDNVTART